MNQCQHFARFQNKKGEFFCCTREFRSHRKCRVNKYSHTEMCAKCQTCQLVAI